MVAASEAAGEPAGSLHVGGAATVVCSSGIIRFSNAGLYVRDSELYQVNDLCRFLTSGTWNYDANSTFNRVADPSDIERTVSGTPVTIDGHSCRVTTDRRGGQDLAIAAWYAEAGQVNLARWWYDMQDMGQADFYFSDPSDPLGMPQTLRMKTPRTTSSSLTGTWTLLLGDDPITPVEADATGTATLTSQLLGHEQITVPAGTFLAAKLEFTLTMTGTLAFQYEGRDYTATFRVSQKRTLWCHPDEGILKETSSLTETGYAAGLGASAVIASMTGTLLP